MKRIRSLRQLFWPGRYYSCFESGRKPITGFKSLSFLRGEVFDEEPMSCHVIVMIVSGQIELSCHTYQHRIFVKGQMVLLARGTTVALSVLSNTEMVLFSFDALQSNCDRRRMETLLCHTHGMKYDFQPVLIKTQMCVFIQSLQFYLKHNMMCVRLVECKHCEFFICLDTFYSKQEIAMLLYPILGTHNDFKSLIYENIHSVESINRLICLSGMSKTRFYETFKKEFGVTAKQWMLKQQADRLRLAVVDSTLSIKELMIACGFENPTVFNRFCHKQFGASPGAFVASLRKEAENEGRG